MTLRLKHIKPLITATVFAASSAAYLTTTNAQNQPMSFFITSAGSGDGANLGGLAGADKTCQTLAKAAGVGNKTWHAYLSASAANGQPAVNAKDRIGKGPWFNAKGVQVASTVADLHSDNNKLGKDNSLTEKGTVVNGRGDTPNTHDILTGSNADGTLSSKADNTCGNWTKNGPGTARVGHHDKQGGGDAPNSWNSAHDTKGCSQQDLVGTGGAGLIYCFAIN
jgi:hypothetical protein